MEFKRRRLIVKKKSVFGIMFSLLLISMLTLAFNVQTVKASGTIYIRADGSIDPSTAPILSVGNVTYIFLDNINESIVVERDNIVVDGAGYTLQGTGTHESKGINLWMRSNVTVKNVKINAFYWGIYLYGSSKNTISGNEVENNSYGIRLEHSSNYNSVLGNNVTNNGVGIMPYYSSTNNRIVGNNIARNTYGMDVYSSSNNSIFENNIETNGNGGIEIRVSSSNNSIYRNNVTENGYGIFLVQSSNNKIYHNFLNNTRQVYDISWDYPSFPPSINIWDDGYPSGGNYWSDYVGVDADGDGIGDTPYDIDENNTDRYPLMHPWSSLPVHNMNTGVGYATIQEAINATETLNGHMIFVEAGTYSEQLVVNKTICLIGEDRSTTIIDGMQKGHVINIIANSVIMTGFTITNSSLEDPCSGIYLYRVNRCNVTENNITNNKYGIYLLYSSNNRISGNTITANNGDGVWLSYYSGNTFSGNNITANNMDGVYLYVSSNNTIIENNIANNVDDGVVLSYSSNYNTVSGNNITNNVVGVTLSYSSNYNTVLDNMFTNDGLIVWDSYLNVVEGNLVNGKPIVYLEDVSGYTVEEAGQVILVNCDSIRPEHLNLSYTSVGVQLWQTTNTNVTNNTIANNVVGVWLSKSSNNTVSGNNIVANSWVGVELSESVDNRFYHNNFIGNTQQVNSNGYANIWNDGYPSGGNYWSDYSGVDVKSGAGQDLLGSDCIGDTPYTIDENNQDRYPLMKPWTLIPTTYTFPIVWGEETFIVSVESNSTISNFTFNQPNKEISFNVSGPNDTIGFCNVTIPKQLLDGPWTVLIDAQLPLYFMLTENETHSFLYFTHTHSTHEVRIIGTHVIEPPPPPPPPLTVSISPLSASINVGESVTFTSTISGGYTPYSCQWYLDGNPVPSANESSWTFTPTTSGIYYVHLKVTDAKRNTTQSETARITVAAVPVGGYSLPIKVHTKTEPIIPYIALITILTAIFVKVKRKTNRKH